jgi:ATP-binding cassette, subfamily B, bacterial HlyB/CyaB
MHSGLKSLVLTARQHGVDLSVDRLCHDYSLSDTEVSDRLLVKIARENGLKARSVRFRWQDLVKLGNAFPVVARLKSGNAVIVTGVDTATGDSSDDQIMVIDPLEASPSVERVSKEAFINHWSGTLLLIRREYALTDEDRPFSFAWLAGRFLMQKALLAELVLIAFILHLFAVLPAVFIMIVLDKVVNYQSTSTLYVITAGVVIAYLFNGLLGYLRQYIILFATSKVDVRLGTQAFSKLMDLPLSYFQKRSVPAVTKSIQQTTSIRQVLTGKFFAAILDASSLFIFIPILFFYSPVLCAIVFFFAALISVNVVIASRYQKDKLSAAAAADGEKQNILMSSVTGIETLKSLALEPVQKRDWEDATARHIVAHVSLGKVNAASQFVSSTLQQLMTVAVIFTGVQLVFSGNLSAGVLIAVNMLAGRVTGPLVQLVSLATDFGKVSSAINSLAAVMNTRGEVGRRGLAADIVGGVSFHGVTFAYEDGPTALNDVSLDIRPRQRIAIVGPAGAGKTTLARHIQRLLRPDQGTVMIDGQDARNIDLGHLRINVAAVTQANTFFKGSIRDNIMKPFPNAPSARLVWATKLVGVHDDVEDMPDSYETILEEGATNLSTGQRQKIAIARALIRNPKILILDEAFSNFDVENQLNIKERIPHINTGRTLIIITNRLSQAMDSDLILVMQSGKIMQQGTHSELSEQSGLYAELWHKELMLMGVEPLPVYSGAAE